MDTKRKLLEKLLKIGDTDGADRLAEEICRDCGADMSRGVSLSDVEKHLNESKRRIRRRTFVTAALFVFAAVLTVGVVFFYGGGADGIESEEMTASASLPNYENISLDVMRFYFGGEEKYGFIVTSSGLAFADGEIYDIDTSVIADLAAMIPFGSTNDTQTAVSVSDTYIRDAEYISADPKSVITYPKDILVNPDSIVKIESTHDDGRCYLIASGREGFGSTVWVYDGSYLEYFMRIFANAKKQVSPIRLDELRIEMNKRFRETQLIAPAPTVISFGYDNGFYMNLNGGEAIRCDGEVLRCLRQLFSAEALCGEWVAPELQALSSTIRRDKISVSYTSPRGDLLKTEISHEKFTDGSPLYELAKAISSQLALKVRNVSAMRSQYGTITQRISVGTIYTEVDPQGQSKAERYERPDMLGVIYDGRLYADLIFESLFDGDRYPDINTALTNASRIALKIDGMGNSVINYWIADEHEYATRVQKLMDIVFREINEGG